MAGGQAIPPSTALGLHGKVPLEGLESKRPGRRTARRQCRICGGRCTVGLLWQDPTCNGPLPEGSRDATAGTDLGRLRDDGAGGLCGAGRAGVSAPTPLSLARQGRVWSWSTTVSRVLDLPVHDPLQLVRVGANEL